MNNEDSTPLTFNPPPSIPLYDGTEELREPLVLTINCNDSIEDAIFEDLDEFVGTDYSIDVDSNISNSTLTLTINSFGSMFPFYCKYINTNTLETRTVHNAFNILPGEKIYEYHKALVARRILNLEVTTKRLINTEGSGGTATTNFRIIVNTNYSTQIPFLLSEIALGDS